MLFMLIIGGLELVEQKFLFAKAKEMFQIVALQVGFVDVEQRQLYTPLTPHEEPQRLLKQGFALLVVPTDLHQRKGGWRIGQP